MDISVCHLSRSGLCFENDRCVIVVSFCRRKTIAFRRINSLPVSIECSLLQRNTTTFLCSKEICDICGKHGRITRDSSLGYWVSDCYLDYLSSIAVREFAYHAKTWIVQVQSSIIVYICTKPISYCLTERLHNFMCIFYCFSFPAADYASWQPNWLPR